MADGNGGLHQLSRLAEVGFRACGINQRTDFTPADN